MRFLFEINSRVEINIFFKKVFLAQAVWSLFLQGNSFIEENCCKNNKAKKTTYYKGQKISPVK